MSSINLNSTRKVGPPRLDKYQRLLHRLYEALIMLWMECPVQGPHLISNADPVNLTACRRRLTRNLAYICDFDKGGKRTTSIGIEDSEQSYIFWVASNELSEDTHVLDFLRATLQRLREVSQQSDPDRMWLRDQENVCIQQCINFSSRRIKKEARLLSASVNQCLTYLNNPSSDQRDLTNQERRRLRDWLLQFRFRNAETEYERCMMAYNVRNDPEMNTLRQFGQETGADTSLNHIFQSSRTIRHFVGRLAEHVRISKQLVEDALRMGHILDQFKVCAILPRANVIPPEADSHTNIESIINRMPSSSGSESTVAQLALCRLEGQLDLESKVREQYQKLHTTPPIVHSEVQVLEHFHRNGKNFADDDHFIGTSKFACFCCKLYFRHHPAKPVEPDSHEQVYTSWSPIALPQGSQDPRFLEFRDIINNVVRGLADAFFRRLRENKTLTFRHPNSITGVSRSVDETDSESEGGVTL